METLLKFLPDRPQPWWIRFGTTALVIGAVGLLRAGSGELTGPYGFVLFILPILVLAVVFDRGTGFLATILALVSVALLLDWTAGLSTHAPAFVVFAFVGFAVAFTGESLRKVAEHAVFAEREKDLMYRELNHRIKNTFSIVQAILRLQGRSASEEVRLALESSISRCNAIFYAHDHISEGARAGTVEMRSYLTTLGQSLADALRGIRPIAITVDSDSVILPSEKAEPVGLIVNELVTNAFKYAFPKNPAGTIRIRFAIDASGYRLEVTDNGSGCPAEVKTGLGTTLTQMLAQQIGGNRLPRNLAVFVAK